MKKSLVTKGLTGLFACSLVLGTSSFAFAKGPNKGQPVHKQKVTQTTMKKAQTASTKTTKKAETKKAKKQAKISSHIGKQIDKRLAASAANINKITQAINSYFKVDATGTAQLDTTAATASEAYNSFKGKLTAEINKLHAIDRLIAADQKRYKSASTDLSTLAAKSQDLQKLASDEITELQTFEKEASTPNTTGTTTGDTTGTTTTTTGTTDSSSTGTTTTTTGTTDTTTTGTATNTGTTTTTSTGTTTTTGTTSATTGTTTTTAP